MIDFKKWTTMQKGEHPRHEHHEDRWIRYHKGHDVTRPYMKYSTSKWEQSMLDVYEILFDPMKHAPITFLEIGVYYGESLRYFREFFTHPDTLLVGLDDQGLTGGDEPGDNFIIKKGVQQDTAVVNEIINTYGPFDVVMDDASHDPAITSNTFDILWPHVKDGGFYIIEDLDRNATGHLLDKVVTTHQGKGFISLNSHGFGPQAGAGGIMVIKKTKDLIAGLDYDLVEE